MSALPSETVTVDGTQLFNVHNPALCQGRPCVVHNPTDHHMRGFRLLWRNDRAIFAPPIWVGARFHRHGGSTCPRSQLT